MIKDGQSDSGYVNTVIRIGNTIHRPVNRWTPAVHALLSHLERVGFSGVPRVIGFDELRREVLSLIPGEVALRPWPDVFLQKQGLVDVGRFLARYHLAVRDFIPSEDTEWHVPGLRWNAGDVIRHGDLGPWNTVWQDGALEGLIDWDFAEPGHRLDDVAQFAWYAVPLRGDSHWKEVGFESSPDFRLRLRTLCSSYGTEPKAVLDALILLQAEEIRRITEFGNQGIQPWSFFRERGDASQILKETNWLQAKYKSLI